MKIVVVCWGSTGDVYPVLALSERLLARGHQVRVCSPALYRDKILEIGAEFHEIGVAFDLAEFHAAMDAIIPKRDPSAMLRLIVEEAIVHRGGKWYQDCLTAMKGFDIAICHSVDIPGQEAAIRTGIPWLTVTYCPGFIKSLDFAPYPFPNWGRVCNAIVWRLVQLRLASSIDTLFNQFIVSVGGKPRSSVALDGMYSPHLNLIAASPTLCPPSDFPPNHKFTGVWHLASPSYIPPTELVDFLAAGPPPVIITFGSMGGSNGRETTEILIAAVRKTNQRAIIQAGWGQLGTQDALTGHLLYGVYPASVAVSERVLRCTSRWCRNYRFGVSCESSVCCCSAPRGSTVLGKMSIGLRGCTQASTPPEPYRRTLGETHSASLGDSRDDGAGTGLGNTDGSRRRVDDSR